MKIFLEKKFASEFYNAEAPGDSPPCDHSEPIDESASGNISSAPLFTIGISEPSPLLLGLEEPCSDFRVAATLAEVRTWQSSLIHPDSEIHVPTKYMEDLAYLLADTPAQHQLKILQAFDDLYSLHPRMNIVSKKHFEKTAVLAAAALVDRTDLDLSVRMESIASLGRWAPRSKTSLPALTQGLKDTDPRIRMACVKSLGAFREVWDELLDETLLNMAKDPAPAVRRETLRALVRLEIDGPASLRTLARSLEDPHERVRREALSAIHELASQYLSGDAFLDPEEVAPATDLLNAIYPLIHDESMEVQIDAVIILKDFKVFLNMPTEQVVRMARIHGQKYPAVGASFHQYWARIQDLGVGITESLRACQDAKDPALREACGKTLAALEAPLENDILRRTEDLDSSQSDTVISALRDLSAWGLFSSTAYSRIENLTNDENPEIRVMALGGLAAVSPQRSLGILLKATEATDPAMRQAAARALGRIPSANDKVLQALLVLQNDSKAQVRSAAVEALGSHAFRPEILKSLLQDLRDEAPSVRLASLNTIKGWIEELTPEAFESFQIELELVRLFSDKEAELRKEALVLFFSSFQLIPNFFRYKASIIRMGQEDPNAEVRELVQAHAELLLNLPRIGLGLRL